MEWLCLDTHAHTHADMLCGLCSCLRQNLKVIQTVESDGLYMTQL